MAKRHAALTGGRWRTILGFTKLLTLKIFQLGRISVAAFACEYSLLDDLTGKWAYSPLVRSWILFFPTPAGVGP